MTTDPPFGELRRAQLSELHWLVAQDPDGHFMGYAPLGWPAETWVLHAIWEDPDAVESDDSREVSGEFAWDSGHFAETPPPGWPRVRWHDLAARLRTPLAGTYDDHPVPPCFRWFPDAEWPESVLAPAEGTIDAPTGERLLTVLAGLTVGGLEAPCFVYYAAIDSPDSWDRLVLAGPLRAVFDAARHATGRAMTPDNIWPADRSWLLFTDYDLWATRLIGRPEVVAALENDSVLETVPFVYQPLAARAKDA